MTLHFAVLCRSVREMRQGIKAARFIGDQLGRRGQATTLVLPLELRLQLLDRMDKESKKREVPLVLEKLAGTYRAGDGFVVVSGEYNHGIPPALKNLLDHFLEELFSSAIGNYLLPRWRVWRGARGNAAAHDLRRTRHAEHLVGGADVRSRAGFRRRWTSPMPAVQCSFRAMRSWRRAINGEQG